MRIITVSYKWFIQTDRIFFTRFLRLSANGSLYRAFTGVFVTFRTHDAALSFDTSTVTECSREFSLVLRRCPEVSQSVRLIFCHFAASRSLDVELGSKARDESGSTARHWIGLNYGPTAVSFISESIIPLEQRGNFQTQFVTLPCPYSYFSFARFVIERESRPAVRARRRRFQHRPTLAINNFPFRRISWSLNWHIRSAASSIIVTGRAVLEEVTCL